MTMNGVKWCETGRWAVGCNNLPMVGLLWVGFWGSILRSRSYTKVPSKVSFEGLFINIAVIVAFYAFRTPEKKRISEKSAWELNLKSAVASADYLRKFRTTERSKPSDHIVLGKTCDQR